MSTPALRDAYLAGASRLVHGYYELRSGKLRFEIDVEDSASHRMLQTSVEEGPPGESLNRAAKALAQGASDFPVSDDALAAWGKGEFERAVALQPRFALGWLDWAQQLSAGGDNARALEVAERGLAQPSLTPAIDKTRLELAVANLRQDDAARLAAARQLAGLLPDDAGIQSMAAQSEEKARNFQAAAHDYQAALHAAPSDTDLLNQLGYCQGMAGDPDAARKTFEQYGHGGGEAAINALDSLGEVLFMNGKFDAAEQQFLNAYAKDPRFLEGQTLWKAAHARWLAAPDDPKNLTAADKIAERYFVARAEARDPLMPLANANWLYETGRRQQAEEFLMRQTTAATLPAAQQQLRVWSSPQPFTSDLGKLEQAYLHADPVNDGLERTLYAEALFQAGRKDEARQLTERWPLPIRDNSPVQGFLYPKFLALKKQLP